MQTRRTNFYVLQHSRFKMNSPQEQTQVVEGFIEFKSAANLQRKLGATSVVTENIIEPLQGQDLGPKQDFTNDSKTMLTWRQLGFKTSRTLGPPQCGVYVNH
ncbi:hypothetical protein TNCV_2203481 [Trichonephila clavipes]|nr:hypothetical protein TNCV_2203481 [Trichonephila clavipes]